VTLRKDCKCACHEPLTLLSTFTRAAVLGRKDGHTR